MGSTKAAEMVRPPQLDVGEDRGPLSWSDRWFSLRNRCLSSPVFQRRAASFFLTSPIARRRARSLFDLVAGFVYSQVLLACVKLDLFSILSEGPQSAAYLSSRLNLSAESTERLLVAAASLQLVECRSGQRYGLGVLGATMVGNDAIAAMVKHHTAFYADLADPVALLSGQGSASHLAEFWPYAGVRTAVSLRPEQVFEYSSLMSSSQPLVAREVLDVYPFKRHRRLLDIGGGEGTFLLQVAKSVPALELILFDVPAVADQARSNFVAQGCSERATAAGGDFFSDPLPPGADLATLIRVVHDHDDDQAMQLLRAAHTALAPGGTLLIAEPMASTSGAEPMGDAYFGFYLLAMGRGKPRTAGQLTDLLRAAGFVDIRLLATRIPLQTQVLAGVAGS